MGYFVKTTAGSAPRQIDTVVFDFDSTLFDTEKKKNGFYAMAECHGYTREQAKQMYDESRREGNRMMISIAGFLSVLQEKLKQDRKQFQSEAVSAVINEMNRGNGLLPGAKALLKFCKKQDIPRFLLSLGVREWQAEKVIKSGADAFFSPEDIVYTDILDTGKIDILRERFGSTFDGRGVVLLNDKPDETAQILRVFPKMFAYVRRELRDDRYTDQDFDAVQREFPGRVFCSHNLRVIQEQFEEAWKKQAKTRKRRPFDTAFIDFDDTIYDTHRMANDMKGVFTALGVTPEDFDKTFLLAVHGANRQFFNYTFDLHLQILADMGYALPTSDLQRELSALLARSYEDPEAEEFLEQIRQRAEQTILLTAGNDTFQRERLAATKLGSYFDEIVIIHEHKEAALASRVRADATHLFVNDDIGQNAAIRGRFPNVVVVTKRHPVKYSEEDLRASGIPYFRTLKEILHYVESLS